MGKSVFVLTHVRELNDGQEDLKFIGVYSSRGEAELAESRLIKLAGFCDAVAGFHTQEYELNKDHWTDGYVTL